MSRELFQCLTLPPLHISLFWTSSLLTLLHSERGNCASYVFFCFWIHHLSASQELHSLSYPLAPFLSTLSHPGSSFQLLCLLRSYFKTNLACIPALYSFAWLTPTCLSILGSHEASPPCPCFNFSLFPECPVHISRLTYILYCSLLFFIWSPLPLDKI